MPCSWVDKYRHPFFCLKDGGLKCSLARKLWDSGGLDRVHWQAFLNAVIILFRVRRSSKVRKEWSFFSTLPCAFMAYTATTLHYAPPVSVFAVWAVPIPDDRNTLTPGQETEWCHAYSRPVWFKYHCGGFPSLVACPRPNRWSVVTHRHFVH
jgi:hypothetical protein